MRVYFKRDETVTFFGVALSDARRIARGVWLDHGARWDVDAATRFCDALVRHPELEAKLVGVLVLARWHRSFPRGLLGTVRRWLSAGHAASWAAVDLVAPALITPLVVRFPGLESRVAGWTRARSLWVRRAAAVTFVPLARKGALLGTAYGVAEALFPDRHDLIHKATGWLLREAGKTDMARLERFLLARGPAVPRTTLRYAIERFPPAARQRLLAATRGPAAAARRLARSPARVRA
jgi:3-methyladenine DNA glycosylase AlkD